MLFSTSVPFPLECVVDEGSVQVLEHATGTEIVAAVLMSHRGLSTLSRGLPETKQFTNGSY
jgi:hypothetical protein